MPRLDTLSRYWETVRWLKPEQFYHRVWFRVARPTPDASPPPPLRKPSGAWAPPSRRRPSMTGPGAFVFLNEPGDLAALGWDDPAREKLWRYNQHYFDDLNAIGAAQRAPWHVSLIEHWLAHSKPAAGTGWEPYPTSLRIVNWIKWALAGGPLSDAARQSLAVQCRWLANRLERHLLGNHLFVNAKALWFAGFWFEGREAESWRDTAHSILRRELGEQILPDGGQFELSPMYHALALEDVLDLVNVSRRYLDALSPQERALAAALEARVAPMRSWLAAMSHPDGRIAFFNDAAFGVAPDTVELDDYARRLGFRDPPPAGPMTWLAESGFARLEAGGAVLLADFGKVGPDYLPGHAHADTLSFELSLGGQRIAVNSGTSVYGLGDERLRQRGTAAHNTVTLAGQNSSDVWSGFRVGRRARPVEVRVAADGEALIAEGAHDGYRFLPGRPLHRRRFRLEPKRLVVEDEITPFGQPAEFRLHLHPAIRAAQFDQAGGLLVAPDGAQIRVRFEGAEARHEPSYWFPEFGVREANLCIAAVINGPRCATELTWP